MRFLRAATLIALVAATVAATVATKPPTALGCNECKEVVTVLDKFADNKTMIARVITALEADCAKAFKANSTLAAVCDDLATGAVDIIPFFFKEIGSLAWDAGAICAAFGKCAVPCCAHPTAPEQIHIAPYSDPAAMTVSWVTLDATATHTVQYGLDPSHLTAVGHGTNNTYTHFGWVGQIHRAIMVNLTANTTYFYMVGDASGGFSQVFSFRTLPADVSEARPLRVAVVADMSYGPESDTTVAALTQLVQAGAVDLVVHDGDISYADGDMQHWDDFMRKIQPIASSVPYIVSPGNHEFWFNFTAYKLRFFMPGGDTAQENMYYALNIGTSVQFAALNTECEADVAYMSPVQLAWLRGALAATPRPRWTIAFGHRPLWATTHGGQDIPQGNVELQHLVEGLFLPPHILIDANVDLVIQGHIHDYERTYPMKKGAATQYNYTNPAAPVYVVNGAAGNREGNDMPPGDEPWVPSPNVGSRAVSFGLFHLTPSSLQWTQWDTTNMTAPIDEFTIVKN